MMFNEHTTLKQMQDTLWDFYKDVHGIRPRHFTPQEWDSREFLQEQFDALARIVDSMDSYQKAEEGWL